MRLTIGLPEGQRDPRAKVDVADDRDKVGGGVELSGEERAGGFEIGIGVSGISRDTGLGGRRSNVLASTDFALWCIRHYTN